MSSWYRSLISNEVGTRNPVEAVDRPTVELDTSPTIGLSRTEAGAFMAAAHTSTRPAGKRDAALLAVLTELGLRVSEATALDVDSFRHNRGHRTVQVRGKGGKVRELPVPAPLGRVLDDYWTDRATAEGVPVEELTGPAFVTRTGGRVDRAEVRRLVRRTAADAGIPTAPNLSPHSLRHTVATMALDAGAPLRDVQDLLGHADPRTTRRYDRTRGSLDRSPAYLIAGAFSADEAAAENH